MPIIRQTQSRRIRRHITPITKLEKRMIRELRAIGLKIERVDNQQIIAVLKGAIVMVTLIPMHHQLTVRVRKPNGGESEFNFFDGGKCSRTDEVITRYSRWNIGLRLIHTLLLRTLHALEEAICAVTRQAENRSWRYGV